MADGLEQIDLMSERGWDKEDSMYHMKTIYFH